MRAGGGGERRLSIAWLYHLALIGASPANTTSGMRAARGDGERGHDLREARAAGDRGDADLAGRAGVAHRHGAGAMLVPGVEHLHAVDLLHRRRPMHVAVAHQGEMGVDAFGGEGLGESS